MSDIVGFIKQIHCPFCHKPHEARLSYMGMIIVACPKMSDDEITIISNATKEKIMSDTKPKSAEELAEEWILKFFGIQDWCTQINTTQGIKGDRDCFKEAYVAGYERGKSDAEACQEGTPEYRLGFVRGKSESQGWIKCSERLPEHSNWVILLERGGAVSIGYYDLFQGDWFIDGRNGFQLDKIEAWAKLPAKPEGE